MNGSSTSGVTAGNTRPRTPPGPWQNVRVTYPVVDTVVEFGSGAVRGTGTVLAVDPQPDGRVAVLTDRTPFHPLDPGWPDQGADLGDMVTADGRRTDVVDCVVGATDGTALFVGADVPVRRGTDGWAFVVVHLVPAGSAPEVGEQVSLHVESAHRLALSAGHTACHVASLALNRAVARFWRKPVATDGLGAPDFDRAAITASRIRPFGSVDDYRLGKSLRRSGCDTEGLLAAVPDVAAEMDATLQGWWASDARIEVLADGPGLSDRRRWVGHLPDGTAEILCGGTHLRRLGQLRSLSVELAATPDSLQLRTSVSL
jgi:alanyl-tRNA synthetase